MDFVALIIVMASKKTCCRYTVATAEEWAKLMLFYDVDYPIIIKKNGFDFETEPSK